MQPGKSSVINLFNTQCQYVIPVFQRGYVWTLEKQIIPLWFDIADRANAVHERKTFLKSNPQQNLTPLRKHFLGSIVLTPVQNYFGRIQAFEVIDGQQRTTTLHMLIKAFYDVAMKLNASVLVGMLEQLTKNPKQFSVATDVYKVWPTQAGIADIQFINSSSDIDHISAKYPVRDGRKKLQRPLLVESYLYLYNAVYAYLCGIDMDSPNSSEEEKTVSDNLVHLIRHSETFAIAPNGALNTERAEALFMALQDYMQLMTLTLEAEDDPQVIFETLNARGEPLLASDLVRNFIFLEATRKTLDVSDLYERFWTSFDTSIQDSKGITPSKYWRELERQGRITHPRIDLFFYNYTILRRFAETKVSSVFLCFKDWWMDFDRDVEVELAKIQTLSGYFKEYVTPKDTSRVSDFSRIMKSLDVSTFTSVYLFLREYYEGCDAGKTLKLNQSLDYLESYIVRRTICGYTTKGYNKIALKILEEISKSDVEPSEKLKEYLSGLAGHSQCWPTDDELKERWKFRPIYQDLKAGKIATILRALEKSSHTNKQESISFDAELTVEHVLPQKWKDTGYYPLEEESEKSIANRNSLLHSFGNLTLLTTALNSSVSNGPFHSYTDANGKHVQGKRSRIAENSLLKMNSYFQGLQNIEWNESQIEKRADALFNVAVKVWARP
jgi:hypothetical protein